MTGACIIGKRIGSNGYARMPSGIRGRYLYAHRVVWEEAFGPIPEGHHVHHRCGTKACINLDHLELHTAREHYAQHRRCDHAARVSTHEGGKTYCRVCRRQRERHRYATDPEFREKHKAKARRQVRTRAHVAVDE